jgi:hypothetical protein
MPDAPEWEKANCTLKHRVREVEAENERLREALRRVSLRTVDDMRADGMPFVPVGPAARAL